MSAIALAWASNRPCNSPSRARQKSTSRSWSDTRPRRLTYSAVIRSMIRLWYRTLGYERKSSSSSAAAGDMVSVPRRLKVTLSRLALLVPLLPAPISWWMRV